MKYSATLFCSIIPAVVLGTAVLVAAAPPSMQENLDMNLSCRIYAGLGEYVRGGDVLPITMIFENRGDSRRLKISTGPDLTVETTVRVPEGRGVKRVLYLPVIRYWYVTRRAARYLRVQDTEAHQTLKKVRLNKVLRQLSRHHVRRRMARSRHVRTGNRRKPLISAITVSGGRSFAVNDRLDKEYDLETQSVGTHLLPGSWRGYTSLDIVIVSTDEWLKTAFPRQAVTKWVAMGGTCLLVESPNGHERKRIVQRLTKIAPFFSRQDDRVCHAGVGEFMFVKEKKLTGSYQHFFAANDLHPTARMGEATKRPWYREVPIRGVGKVPFWPLLAFLVVFAVIVGPLGWWYMVSRKGMGLLYYILAPAVSLVFILLVVAVDVLHEGVRPRASCRVASFVDQQAGMSLHSGVCGVYAPFGAGTALRVPNSGLLHWFGPTTEAESARRRPHRVIPSCKVNYSGGGSTWRGQVPARQEVWFGMEEVKTERRRLLFDREEGTLNVENHLGCALADVVLHAGGEYYHIEALPEGARREAEPLASDEKKKLLRSYVRDIEKKFNARSDYFVKRIYEKFSQEDLTAYIGTRKDNFRKAVWLNGFRESGMKGIVAGVAPPLRHRE